MASGVSLASTIGDIHNGNLTGEAKLEKEKIYNSRNSKSQIDCEYLCRTTPNLQQQKFKKSNRLARYHENDGQIYNSRNSKSQIDSCNKVFKLTIYNSRNSKSQIDYQTSHLPKLSTIVEIQKVKQTPYSRCWRSSYLQQQKFKKSNRHTGQYSKQCNLQQQKFKKSNRLHKRAISK